MDGGWVGVLTADLHLPDSRSLKAKRRELLRVKHGLSGRLGCSVAEVDHHELWQRARISLAVVGRTAGDVEEQLREASRRLYGDPVFQVASLAQDVSALDMEPAYALDAEWTS